MLSFKEYNDLWTTAAPNGFGQTIAPPSYNEYVIRENQLQDYLDIFRGSNTREVRPVPNGGWYYDHPFDLMIQIKDGNPPKIKFIMIAEAAPELKPSSIDVNRNDNKNTYFFNTKHIKPTPYFSAPCKAFGVGGINKVEKLWNLASKGVLLLDLFPFAIAYDTRFRNKLNDTETTNYFLGYDDGAPDNIGHRINAIRDEKLLDEEKNRDMVKLALIGPPAISHFIAIGINSNPNWNTFGCAPRKGINNFAPIGSNLTDNGKFYSIQSELNGFYTTYLSQCPYYACCCYSGSNTFPPHELFIRNAFEF